MQAQHAPYQQLLVVQDAQNWPSISTIPNLPNINNIDVAAGQNLYQQFLKNHLKDKMKHLVNPAVGGIMAPRDGITSPTSGAMTGPIGSSVAQRASSNQFVKLQGNTEPWMAGAFTNAAANPLKLTQQNDSAGSNIGNSAIPAQPPQKQGEKRSQGHKPAEPGKFASTGGYLGAVGTQMSLHSQPQVASPKPAPERPTQRPNAAASAQQVIDSSQETTLRPAKSLTEVAGRERSQAAPAAHPRVPQTDGILSRNMSPS